MPDHFCGVADLDYEHVDEGVIRCVRCGRRWMLLPSGWVMQPQERAPGARLHR